MISTIYLKPTFLTDLRTSLPIVRSLFVGATLNEVTNFIHTGLSQSLSSTSVWDKGIYTMYRLSLQLPPIEGRIVGHSEDLEPIYATVLDPYGIRVYLSELRKLTTESLTIEEKRDYLYVFRFLEIAATFHYEIWITQNQKEESEQNEQDKHSEAATV